MVLSHLIVLLQVSISVKELSFIRVLAEDHKYISSQTFSQFSVHNLFCIYRLNIAGFDGLTQQNNWEQFYFGQLPQLMNIEYEALLD